MKIKLCGIRRDEDIEYMNELLPDYVGFILAEGYRRTVSPDTALYLRSRLNPKIKTVGVFVNQPVELVKKCMKKIGLDVCQLHGDENAEYIDSLSGMNAEIWKAVRVKSAEDIENVQKLNVSKLLLDSFSESTYGGSGKTADWEIIKSVCIKKPFLLAGGLNESNIEKALKAVKPYGADISGGIETNGFKDREKAKRITDIIRSGHSE